MNAELHRNALGIPETDAPQPWADPGIAELYDLFPFDADLPFYRDLAERADGAILELACGTGRVALPLAQAGHEVMGVDSSPYMLAIARRKLRALPVHVARRVQLVQGDMRWFELDREFNLAIVATKSFGYLLEDDDQLRALAAIRAHLRSGGILVLDLLNPSPQWAARATGLPVQDLFQESPDGELAISRSEWVVDTDEARRIRVTRSVYEIRRRGTTEFRTVEWPFRYIDRQQAEELLAAAGFSLTQVFGGYAREPYEADSPALLTVARRR